MKKHILVTTIMVVILIIAMLGGCSKDPVPQSNPAGNPENTEEGRVDITFDFVKQSGHASNQFAVWIENTEGELVKTIYATEFTADGGFEKRPDSISTWVEKSSITEMENKEIDAITGPTPKTGFLTFVWDLTDTEGNTVEPGDYTVFVEGSLRWKNRVIYEGVITIGDSSSEAIMVSNFIFEESDDQPALTEEDEEVGMIGPVTAIFITKNE